jgi:hypothetical protein
MKANMLLLLILVILILSSCQKEVDYANRTNNGNNTNTENLLVKTVAKTGTDSIVSIYTYNADKKLINLKITGRDQGADVDREFRYYRNAAGIITHYSAISADLVSVGLDSLLTVVHYNTAISQYTSYVLNINIPGFTLLDSSAFVIDGSGRIVEEDVYESPSGTGNDYYFTGKAIYTYSNGNMTGLDLHNFDQSGTEVFTGHTKYQYDSKINPLRFGNEGLAMGHSDWVSAGNVASGQLSDSNGPVDDQTLTISYTYNNDNKPATSIATILPDNIVTNTTFYYQ